MTKKILVLAANPKDTTQLRLDEEIREIENGLERSQYRDEFSIKSKLAVRPLDVRRVMLDYKPTIVHFCGHGAGVEGLAFEDERGFARLVKPEALSDFFALFADQIECVVLNACYSEPQAEAIANHVKFVVGMKREIGDRQTIEFATAFYDALGAGKSYDFAYKLACNAILWTHLPENSSPVLKSKLTSPPEATPPQKPGGAGEAQPPETPSTGKMSRAQRNRKIDKLLEEPAEDTLDGLPEGLYALFTDASLVRILEDKLDPDTSPVVLTNAIRAIGLLADWLWDHREIKTPRSIPKLVLLYEWLPEEEEQLRIEIIQALGHFSGGIPFPFLVKRLALDSVPIKAEILSMLQFYVDRPYLATLFEQELLPLLHQFCTYPQIDSVYSNDYYSEMDFRYWVFRCLGGLKKPESAPVIENFIEKHAWPLDTLAEAADAYWKITRNPKYVDILRKAKKEGVVGNAEQALLEIEAYLKKQAAGTKSKKRRAGPKTTPRPKT